MALFMDLVWSAILMGILEERDGTVVGVSWSLPPGVASGIMHTSSFSCLSPAADIIKKAWFTVGYAV